MAAQAYLLDASPVATQGCRMSRAMVVCTSDNERRKAADWALRAPTGTRILFKNSKRSLPQNDLMWSLLTELARQLKWHGVTLTADDWKIIMLDGLKREMRVVPNIDGDGLVNLGRSSSDLSKEEMSDLIELIRMFGAKHGVTFGDQEAAA
jgi:hypothetical protein